MKTPARGKGCWGREENKDWEDEEDG